MNKKMSIIECQEMAKEEGFNTATFDLCCNLASKKCKWLDAYLGAFEIEGVDGFCRPQDISAWDDIWCENFQANNPEVKI